MMRAHCARSAAQCRHGFSDQRASLARSGQRATYPGLAVGRVQRRRDGVGEGGGTAEGGHGTERSWTGTDPPMLPC